MPDSDRTLCGALVVYGGSRLAFLEGGNPANPYNDAALFESVNEVTQPSCCLRHRFGIEQLAELRQRVCYEALNIVHDSAVGDANRWVFGIPRNQCHTWVHRWRRGGFRRFCRSQTIGGLNDGREFSRFG